MKSGSISAAFSRELMKIIGYSSLSARRKLRFEEIQAAGRGLKGRIT